jgi:hypothetical protein
VKLIVTLLEAAWRTIPAMDAEDVTRHIARLDRRDSGFAWKQADRGPVLEQRIERQAAPHWLYSFREEGNEEFPFEGMNQLVQAAKSELRRAVRP